MLLAATKLLRPQERLRIIVTLSVCLSVCVSVCLSARISPEPHARSLPIFCAYCPRPWLIPLGHIYDRLHRLSPEKGFSSPTENALPAAKEGWECIARAKYAIYNCLVIMAALWNRAGHYIFPLWFLSFFFLLFSSPNLSGRRLDVYHTSTHGVALVRI